MQLFSLVLASMLADLHLTRGRGGALNSITLTTAAAGGLGFGVADRYGRKRALMISILLYSVFSALCGLSRNVWQLGIFSVLLGFGMGGEWAASRAPRRLSSLDRWRRHTASASTYRRRRRVSSRRNLAVMGAEPGPPRPALTVAPGPTTND